MRFSWAVRLKARKWSLISNIRLKFTEVAHPKRTTPSIFDVVKAPVGWIVLVDRVRAGGVYATKEAALEDLATRPVSLRDNSAVS